MEEKEKQEKLGKNLYLKAYEDCKPVEIVVKDFGWKARGKCIRAIHTRMAALATHIATLSPGSPEAILAKEELDTLSRAYDNLTKGMWGFLKGCVAAVSTLASILLIAKAEKSGIALFSKGTGFIPKPKID